MIREAICSLGIALMTMVCVDVAVKAQVEFDVATLIGDRITDVDEGAVQGIAIIDSSPGWEYSLDDGASWLPVGSPSEAGALLLSEASRLRHDRRSLPMLWIRAWDQSAGTVGTYEPINATGGETAYSDGTAWRVYVAALAQVDADMRLQVSVKGFDGVNNVAQVNNPVYSVEPPEMGTWTGPDQGDPGNVAGYFVPAGQVGSCVLIVTGEDKRGNQIATPGTLGIEVVAGPASRIEVLAIQQVER